MRTLMSLRNELLLGDEGICVQAKAIAQMHNSKNSRRINKLKG
jgi:hypothetical protein